MNTFTASNGFVVNAYTDDRIEFRCTGSTQDHNLTPKEVRGLREFFRAEEDERLGRWRWPEDPDYVVYPDRAKNFITQPAVIVVNEADGATSYCGKHGTLQASGNGAEDELIESAALAYFDAHPEPKPWDTASVGEVWALTIAGEESPVNFRPGLALHMDGRRADVDRATAGHRIWPEDAS